MANFVIKTAHELGDNDVEARAGARRAARETPVLRAVLWLFAESGGATFTRTDSTSVSAMCAIASVAMPASR